MSTDILKSINKIKISINENDQVLWECQASAKCYNQATEKLKEECERLNIDIAKIDEEILELEPQLEILGSCYETQVASLTLNQESLVNQRLYKKCVVQNINKHQEEVARTVEEYSLHFQKCKEKLELTNPAYRTLQEKKTELQQCKIRCLDIKQKIAELKKINKHKREIRQKLFYGDIIAFANAWLAHEKYSKEMKRLLEEKRIEREYMQKLVEAAELLKQKQKNRFCQKESPFKVPQIDFPKMDIHANIKEIPEKANRQFDNNCFNDIKTLLERKDTNMTHPIQNDNIKFGEQNKDNLKFVEQKKHQTFEFNACSSKVRILENRILKQHNESEQPFLISKEERSKAIAAKLQKVVENFNKSISRQNSKNAICSQKSTSSDSEMKIDQKIPVSQEKNATKGQKSINLQYEGTGASQQLQNLDITKLTGSNNPEPKFLSQECNTFNQSSKNQHQGRPASRLIQGPDFSQRRENQFTATAQENLINKKYSQEKKAISKGSTKISMGPLESTSKNVHVVERNTIHKINNSQSPDRPVRNFESTFGEKSNFTMSMPGFGAAFNMSAKNNVEEKKSVGRVVSFKKPEAVVGLTEKPYFIEETRTNLANPLTSDGTSTKKSTLTEKNQFMLGESVLGINEFKNFNNPNNEHGEARRMPDSSARSNESYLKMGGMSSYNFGNETQFSQMLNDSYDYDGGYTSPQFDQSYMSPQGEDNINTPANFGGPSNFTDQPLFSFGQVNAFNFK